MLGVIRRRRLPPELTEAQRAFAAVSGLVSEGVSAMVAAVPTARVPGRPVADALLGFEESLRSAEEGMAAWWHPAVAEQWEACAAGLRRSLDLAEVLRLSAPDLPFDRLAFTV